jgi:hypothetical protein
VVRTVSGWAISNNFFLADRKVASALNGSAAFLDTAAVGSPQLVAFGKHDPA